MIQNPVLPGFHPNPSIVRTEHGYYLASSTFEWRPGIRLHRSADLVTWEPAGHVLTDPELWDMPGIPNSGGVWAPSLSHHEGLFWLVFAIVRTKDGPFKDMDVMLVTAPSIDGPWSAPRYLGGDGFDPSIFHDDDGRHWLVNMRWDHRPDHPSFAGITLQEVTTDGSLFGEPRLIHRQDELVEGPNIYRRDGWYLLMVAEGGTGWNHGITVLRSRELAGPYEPDPHGPLLTTRDDPKLPLQKAEHGELVETTAGEWYLAHLASRPVDTPAGPRCVLGRETCLQPIVWTPDGWPRLAHGGHWPAEQVPAPAAATHPAPAPADERDDFDEPVLSPHWASPRRSVDPSWADLATRPGALRLHGGRTLFSGDGQSLVARRLTAHRAEAETLVRVHPRLPGQQAGLVCWYDTTTFYLLAVAGDEHGPRLIIPAADEGAYAEIDTGIAVPDGAGVHLLARFDGPDLRFSARLDRQQWQEVGPVLDAAILSDDHGSKLRFTGAFVGIAALDPATRTLIAEFDHFTYRPR
jgi:xylan 1,4-beta-xylosidase